MTDLNLLVPAVFCCSSKDIITFSKSAMVLLFQKITWNIYFLLSIIVILHLVKYKNKAISGIFTVR